jgi:hypothetical protein
MYPMEPASVSRDAISDVRVAPEVSDQPLVNSIDVDNSLSPSGSREVLRSTSTIGFAHVDIKSSKHSQPEMDPELAGLDALEDGRPGERPAYPFTTLIRYAISESCN